MTVKLIKHSDVGAPTLTGQAGSLISILDYCLTTAPGVNWTKTYSGTNKAVYQQGIGSTGFFLRVDDTGPYSGQVNSAGVHGYEIMSDVDTGTGNFPISTQNTTPTWYKSDSTDATIRDWIFVGDERAFFLFVNPNSTTVTNGRYMGYFFGDIKSYHPTTDGYGVLLTAVQFNINGDELSKISTSLSQAINYHYFARSWTGLGTSITAGKHQDSAKGNNVTTMGLGGMNYPHPMDGGLYLSRVWAHEPIDVILRGHLEGIWSPLHTGINFNSEDTFSGTGTLAGRTFLFIRTTNSGTIVMETSNTWWT